MKLIAFTVANFRSITGTYRLPLGNFAVLVGPNNEGKSNILKAICISLGLLEMGQLRRPSIRRRLPRYMYHETDRLDYDWTRDFPIGLQTIKPQGRSEFTLEFAFSDEEFAVFREQVNSNLATNLKIKLSLGKEDAKFDVIIQGKGKQYLEARRGKIAEFIRDRLFLQYIPSIRTADLSRDVVEKIIAEELAHLETDAEYLGLFDKIAEAQRPILTRIANELTSTVQLFVPDVREITIEPSSELRRAVQNAYQIMVDDGANTDFALKGDGVKSLTAISLLRHVSQAALGDRSLILAVEEPEAHLHPTAIHRLRDVFQEIAETHQVIVSTHSPVLVDRARVSSNIIVRSNKARPAQSLQEIRDVLGVEMSDNLSSAYLILLVEGTKDKKVIERWLTELSPEITNALMSGLFSIDTLEGASSLRYKAGIYKNSLCNVHVFLDNDQSATAAIDKAEAKGVLNRLEYHLAIHQGMRESELEDLLQPDVYTKIIKQQFGVDIGHRQKGNNRKKWSDRLQTCFMAQGKRWNEKVKNDVKTAVAGVCADRGLCVLNAPGLELVKSLGMALEGRLRTHELSEESVIRQ